MKSFAAAKKLYEEGKYQQSLAMYSELGSEYGYKSVEFNIKACNHHLEKVRSSISQKNVKYNRSNTSQYRIKFSKIYEASNKTDFSVLVELAHLDLIDNRLKECLHKIDIAISLNQSYLKSYEIGEQASSLLGDLELANKYQRKKYKQSAKSGYETTQLCSSQEEDSAINLVQSAEEDIINGDFVDALKKAQKAITLDKNYRKSYSIGEQAAIELQNFDLANSLYLSQPPVINSPEAKKRVRNPTLPKDFTLPPIIGSGNGYDFILERSSLVNEYDKKVSIIIPVFNRYQILANTLAALTHQTYPKELIEVIVVDDGSSDEIFSIVKKYEKLLTLFYARQSDNGFRVASARNLGLKLAKNDYIIFMDADILPNPKDVESYMKVLHASDDCVLIGHRRYVDTSNIIDDTIVNNIDILDSLPDINPDNDEADAQSDEGLSYDWRFDTYKNTDDLRTDLYPFTKAAGGNIAFSRKVQQKAGLMDEAFTSWGCEDSEFAYRLYLAGAYFIPMLNIVSLHQEPLEKVETINGKSFRKIGHINTKKLFASKCPAPVIRKYDRQSVFEIPKVSIYIPAYNASDYIIQAIESCLHQKFDDLEVCICNDGSTDNTLALLEKYYNDNPKVRWITQKNKGIGAATNQAIRMCRGMYIAQLDADDVLKPTAVRSCVEVLDKENMFDAVYTDCDYIDKNGTYIRDGWCSGEFDREWMATGMIATHFRMFRKKIWSRIEECNENIKNAVDLDLWLKINEKANIKHIHKIEYSYRWHGKNTSIQNRKAQENNHLIVVEDSLIRQNLDRYWSVKTTNNPLNPREFRIVGKATSELKEVSPKEVFLLIPTCKKNSGKMEAVRKTWASQLSKYGFRYLFLLGDPSLETAQVKDDILIVPCADDYESLLLKLSLGYKFIYQNFNFDYVYKIDDDCYPDLNKLSRDILPQLKGKQFAGGDVHRKGNSMNNKWHYGKCSASKFDIPYQYDVAPFDFAKGGYGYFIRKDVLPIIFQMNSVFNKELEEGVYSPEDVRISEILNYKDIKPHIIDSYSVAKYDSNNNAYLVYDIGSEDVFFKLSN